MRMIRRLIPCFIALGLSMTCIFAVDADIIVAKDGSGDYTSIQAAINAVPDNKDTRTVIYIKSGTYDTEKLIVRSTKTNITLLGESRTGTIISYHIYDCSEGKCPTEDAALWPDDVIRTSATLTIQGDGFRAENLTIQNTAGPVGQAQAITVQSDKVVFINCDLKGYQDTIYFWSVGKRTYFQNCLVIGRTDYIYGGGIAFFYKCEIRSWGGGWITAPSTAETQKYGFIFYDCNITYASGSPRSGDDGNTIALGRPRHNYPKVTWIYSDMTSMINPLGWPTIWNMDYAATSDGLELYEYENTGGGADMSGRANWVGIRALTSQEAPLYERAVVLAGSDNWDPVTEITGDATLTKHGAGSSNQTISLGDAITAFYYSWTNATSVIVSGMPSGINTTINTNDQTVSFTGAPTETGIFNFTVTTTGGTTIATKSGSITVNTTEAATLTKHGAGSANQTVEAGAAITDFYYSWTNATTVAVTGLPTGITATVDADSQTVTISGTPTKTGTFSFTVTTVGGSTNVSISGTITVNTASTTSACDNPVSISIPFSYDGTGEYCWVTPDAIAYINSWNTELVEINGTDYTNTWSNSFPAPVNGNYYIHYIGNYTWSHFEAPSTKSATSSAIPGFKDSQGNTGNIRIYPNPFQDQLFISIIDAGTPIRFEIYDLEGKVVKVINNPEMTDQVVQLYIGGNSGQFIVKLITDKGCFNRIVSKK